MTFQSLLAASVFGVFALIFAHTADAQSRASIFAHQHFNESADGFGDIRRVPQPGSSVVVSTRGNGPLSQVFTHFNQDQDSRSDLRGLRGATIYRNTPTIAADIFRELREASREDED